MRAGRGLASPGHDEGGRGGEAGCSWPPGLRLPTWSENQTNAQPWLCPDFLRIQFCWEWLLLIQVCPQKALIIESCLLSLISIAIRDAYLLVWVGPFQKD